MPSLPDTMRAVVLDGPGPPAAFQIRQLHFYPIEYLPRGVRLTAYHGEARDLPSKVLQDFLDAVAAGRFSVPVHRSYTLDDIVEAHTDMEAGKASGKLVVTI